MSTIKELTIQLEKGVREKNLITVKAAVEKGASPAWVTGNNCPPIFYLAIEHYDEEIFYFLLKCPDTAKVINGSKQSWSPFSLLISHYLPDVAMDVLEYAGFEPLRGGQNELFVFENFVLHQMGARKDKLCPEHRWNSARKQKQVLHVVKQWFIKTKVEVPKKFYQYGVFIKEEMEEKIEPDEPAGGVLGKYVSNKDKNHYFTLTGDTLELHGGKFAGKYEIEWFNPYSFHIIKGYAGEGHLWIKNAKNGNFIEKKHDAKSVAWIKSK
eukprot:469806_1